MTRQEALSQLVSGVALDAKVGALVTARTILTEERTDALIAVIEPKIRAALPVWLRWVPIGAILDKVLPGTLLSVIEEVLA